MTSDERPLIGVLGPEGITIAACGRCGEAALPEAKQCKACGMRFEITIPGPSLGTISVQVPKFHSYIRNIKA